MVAAAKDDDSTPHSVVVQIFPEEDYYEDDRFSVESSGGTRSSDGRSSVGDFDSSDEADTPQSVFKMDSLKSPLREASTPSSCPNEVPREAPWVPTFSPIATPARTVTRPQRLDNLPKRDFEIELVKGDGQELGLDVLQNGDGSVCISRVKPGLVEEWGEKHPDRKVQARDIVLAVNGEEGGFEELVGKIKGASQLKLLMRRLQEFEVCIREQGKLGVDVGFTSCSMKILTVSPWGKAQEWNESASSDTQVRPGDHIVQVNGLRGKSQDLLQELKGSAFPMDLVILRGSGPPSAAELAGTQDPPSPTARWRPDRLQFSEEQRQPKLTSENLLHHTSQYQARKGEPGGAKGMNGKTQKGDEAEEEEAEENDGRDFFTVQVW